MKAQLVVVRGKPEGKVIPLVGPKFKIGRGETCHLRPNSEQVSREHAEFTLEAGAVIVRDLGSRNGTLVNGKALTTEPCKLKDRDLVQVGPLTFAVSILDAPSPATRPIADPVAAAPANPKASPDDISTDDIDSWLLGENAAATADQPTAVYGGDTITITAFRDAQAARPPASSQTPPSKPPSIASDEEYERQSEEEDKVQTDEELVDENLEDEEQEEEEQEEEAVEASEELEEEFLDESNPFYAAKKAQKEQAKAGGAASSEKASFKDSSDAANEILRKLMERRRASKSS
jgi:FHA domain